MLPSELLFLADRLAESCVARVRILSNGLVATIVPPGRDASNRKILVNAGTDAKPRILAIKPEKVELLPAPDPEPAPLRLGAPCVHCQAPATLRCTACKAPLCGAECADRNWKQHKNSCRAVEARMFGRCRAGEQRSATRAACQA